MTDRSINAPGSPSSALQMTYFSSPGAFLANCHFCPVRNPAPPRPRSPDSFMTLIIESPVISLRAFSRALYPPRAMYSPIFSGSIIPRLDNAISFCFPKNSISSIFGIGSASFVGVYMSLSTGCPSMQCCSISSGTSLGDIS